MASDNTHRASTGGALVPADAFDADLVDSARGAISSGLLSDAEITRHYNLSPRELEAAKKAAPKKLGIDAELRALAKLKREDPRAYFSNEAQARELELLEMREASAEAGRRERSDGSGLPAELREAWQKQGGLEANLARVQDAAETALLTLDTADAAALQESFDSLPQSARSTAFSYLAVDGGGWPPASDSDLVAFAESDEGKALVEEWGRKAAKNLATVRGRLKLILDALPTDDQAAAAAWLDGLSTSQAKAVLASLAGPQR